MDAAPLIVTLTLNEEAFHFFDALRQQHFPPERNFLKAHLTLFHHLPADEKVLKDVEQCCLSQAIIPLLVASIISLGRGVAYKIESPPLLQLHRQLQQQWQPWLTLQDAQKLRPHITVQNKTDPATAAKLKADLEKDFTPFSAQGIGLSVWHYLNGPWQWLHTYPFIANEPAKGI